MEDRAKYTSEFANRYGETWVLEYDYDTGQGVLRGSDVNGQSYPVVDGHAVNLLLNDEELVWLSQVWKEAISH